MNELMIFPKHNEINRVSLSVGAIENEKSKSADEKYYKKYLILAVILHIINCLLQAGYTILPLIIRSSNETEWYAGAVLVKYDEQYFQLFKCFGHDDSPCGINLNLFYDEGLDKNDFVRLKGLNIFVRAYLIT